MSLHQSIRISETVLLLVEGKDDEGFLRYLCEHIGLSGVQILRYGGKTQLRRYLKALPLLSDYELVDRIGIIRDADEDAEAAFESIRSALTNAALPAPSIPSALSDGIPQISIMIVPHNAQQGCLETLLWQTVEATHPAQCINRYVDCVELPASGNRRDKAKVHAYISTRRKPGLKIGEATKAGYWDLDHAALRDIKNYLRTLAA